MSNKVVGIATEIVVMAVVVSMVLLFVGICVVVFIHVYITNLVERIKSGDNSMSHDDLQRLPCFDFKAGEKGSSPIDCAVCLENSKVGDKCKLLPCRHNFHANCVDLWLLKTPIYPIY
uniref:RING-type domain-containing protein n=1 Tax=Nelumbo nucifera TaxID=4432 RepID=A0A822ZP80_NELNU|nr:TPA_asm: hypothetical protein HUJ06_004500 [Nelumbo nucifera]